MVSTRNAKTDQVEDPQQAVDQWLSTVSGGIAERDRSLLLEVGRLITARAVASPDQSAFAQRIARVSLPVATVLADLHLDGETLAAALLHTLADLIALDAEECRDLLGIGVADLLRGLDKMAIIDTRAQPLSPGDNPAVHNENLRKMLLAMANDVRVVFIRLAESLVNMRNLRHVDDEARRIEIAREVREIDAPLANRLGIWQIKWELEDLCFRYLEPASYQEVARLLDERRVDREAYIQGVTEVLQQELAKSGIEARVSGRPKHIYSIWRKMKGKDIRFNDLFDVRAVRVLVGSVTECYAALGIVHGRWTPIPNEFDDYIATPKENMYQSLHTAVVGPEGKTLEVQIRTQEMHQHCEYGMAAHWRYKEGGRSDVRFEEKINWLRQMLDWNSDAREAGDFIDRFKSESFQDRIYVLTPNGRIVDLPQGATPLDFAYYIHTDLGHRFRGALVNGRMVSGNYTLHNGEQIEILTLKNGHPSRDWLNPNLGYLKTSRARSKVRSWFSQQDQGSTIDEGRTLLERELRRLGVTDVNREHLARQLNFTRLDDMLVALANGDLAPVNVARALKEQVLLQPARRLPTGKPASGRAGDNFTIMGVGGLMSRLAQCCRPVPHEPIVGFITKGRGVSVHRRDCPAVGHLRARDPGRLVDVAWGQQSDGVYPVDIEVEAFDRRALLSDITTVLSNEKMNVIAVNTLTDPTTQIARMQLTVQVSDMDQLSRVLGRIEQIPNVSHVARKQN